MTAGKAAADPNFTDPQTPALGVVHHRSLFVSDLHMGARGCGIDRFLGFLRRNSADTIYLVGDIFDTWFSIRRNWTPAHDEVLRLLLSRAQAGSRLVYLPGNHDRFMRAYLGICFQTIEIAEHVYHRTADGRSYLVLHGDVADGFWGRGRFLSRFGGSLDHLMRGASGLLNTARGVFGLAATNRIENFISRANRLIRHGNRFEKRLTAMARTHGQDGVICGHFHKPALHQVRGMVYANCGDWIENFTAIAERHDGSLLLLRAPEPVVPRQPEPTGQDIETRPGVLI